MDDCKMSEMMGKKKLTKLIKLIYVFDDINYLSGARQVMFYQIKRLKEWEKEFDISIFSLTRPDPSGLPPDILEAVDHGLWDRLWDEYQLFGIGLKEALTSGRYPFREKCRRLWFGIERYCRKEGGELPESLKERIKGNLEQFDCVIVVSEASRLRSLVGELKRPKKIQWIHTDYKAWSEFSAWTKAVTQNDGRLYRNFDTVVALSEHSKEGMLEKLPELEGKIVVIPNLIDGDRILEMAGKEPDVEVRIDTSGNVWNLITVGRLEREKGYDRILDLCAQMKKDGCIFKWYLVGNGNLEGHLRRRVEEEGLGDCVVLTGGMKNPYPLMAQCDRFVLLSEYEGTPVTIDEAMVLGLPVIARDVGGIREQMGRGMGDGSVVGNGENIEKVLYDLVRTGSSNNNTEKSRNLINWDIRREIYNNSNAEIIIKVKRIFAIRFATCS